MPELNGIPVIKLDDQQTVSGQIEQVVSCDLELRIIKAFVAKYYKYNDSAAKHDLPRRNVQQYTDKLCSMMLDGHAKSVLSKSN
jgi:hypothetical protein